MLLAHHTARGWSRHGYRPQHAIAGAVEDALASLESLKAKYGDSLVQPGHEIVEILQALVDPFLGGESWQRCTLEQWLNGLPSEDDLSWKGKYFSEMPTLEETCGDHTTFGSQYDEAFDDLKSAGCPQDAIDWLRKKGKANFDFKNKARVAEKEGSSNVGKGLSDAGDALNPLSTKSPFFWWILGFGVLYVTLKAKPWGGGTAPASEGDQ